MYASSEASGKSVLRVHARGPKRYEFDECARVKPFLYMHAQLSSRKISLKVFVLDFFYIYLNQK